MISASSLVLWHARLATYVIVAKLGIEAILASLFRELSGRITEIMEALRILIARYFRSQRLKGRSLFVALILFIPVSLKYLPKVLNHLVVFSFMSGKKNVITGHGFYDKPLLISYPRSGTNWIRYIIECLSGKPTPGQERVHSGTDYIIDRAHKAYPVIHRHDKVILILRDYRECLLRSNIESWLEFGDVERFLEERGTFTPPHWYIDNLKEYDLFQGNKLLVYYEDLLAHPDVEIPRISNFLNFNAREVEAFLANLDEHKQSSISLYTSGGHASETKGDTKKASYHADMHVSPEQKEAFDSYYIQKYPSLFEKYLSRYRI